MEKQVYSNVGVLENSFFRIQFSGIRDMNEVLDNWLEIKRVVNGQYEKLLILDNMAGEISNEGICFLLEMLSEHYCCKNKKIAIILNDANSYNTHLYDIFAKHWGLTIRHFVNEKDAADWLLK